MFIRSITGLTVALAILATPLAASAHVAPSVNENNRYLRLTTLGDRVRVAYTVYLGEVPGARARRRLDKNRDGVVDEKEADSYGRQIAQAVEQRLTFEIDGAPYALDWTRVYVGLGTPETEAGAFSIDLIGWVCVRDPDRREHRLVLRDEFRLPNPGETEIYVEESPGVTVTRSTLGPETSKSTLKFRWWGDRGYLRTLGYYLEFSVDPSLAAVAPTPDPCSAGGSGAPQAGRSLERTRTYILVAAAVIVAALGALVALLIRVRRAYRKTKG